MSSRSMTLHFYAILHTTSTAPKDPLKHLQNFCRLDQYATESFCPIKNTTALRCTEQHLLMLDYLERHFEQFVWLSGMI